MPPKQFKEQKQNKKVLGYLETGYKWLVDLWKYAFNQIKNHTFKVNVEKMPEIKIPEPEIKIPEIPPIKVPEIKAPDVNIPPIEIPEVNISSDIKKIERAIDRVIKKIDEKSSTLKIEGILMNLTTKIGVLEKKIIKQVLPVENGYLQVELPQKQIDNIVEKLKITKFGGKKSIRSGASYVDGETPTGTINGSNKTFTLSNAPHPTASLQLYLNGLLLKSGSGNDYTLDGKTITMAYAPPSGSNFLAFFRY